MTDASSPFLNIPPRSENEARVAHEQTERERRRRLEQHGADFCRRILDGAYERIYQPDGGYRLREIATGAWLDDPPSRDVTISNMPSSTAGAACSPASSPVAVPDTIVAARRFGYGAALRDMTRWISGAAIEPCMHADTLAALNAQISALADHAATAAGDVTEPV